MTSEQFFSLLQGAWGTLVMSLLTFAIGGLAGLALAMARISPARPVRVAAAAWIQLIQGTPLLVLMGLCFYGPDIAGIVHLVAADADLTLVHAFEPVDAAQRRALARAALANDGHHLALGDGERHPAQHMQCTEALVHRLQMDDSFSGDLH